MRRTKLVLVGNGMAGARTLEDLLRLAPDLYEIAVFGAEPHPNYNRILLSPVLAGEMQASEIVLNDLGWYATNGIRLHLGSTVKRIDRVRREVVADDGTAERYDRLIIATGSSPVILPIPGTELEGVLTYRDIADTEAMIRASAQRKRAVVIGGGLLGLEAANGLRARGMDVTVIHLMPWLMERQLDRTAAGMLQRSLEARGLKFLLETKTAELLGDGAGCVAAVKLASGATVSADLVVMAVGIRPNTALAQSAGLRVDRGIVVSDTMQTYDPRIYAVGECVAHRGVAYGLVAPLFEMAKVCANHLACVGIGSYRGSVPSTRLKVTGIDVFSAGEFMGGPASEDIVLQDPQAGVYKRVVLRDNRLVGGVLYGDSTSAGWLLDLMSERRDVSALRDALVCGPELAGLVESGGRGPAPPLGTGGCGGDGKGPNELTGRGPAPPLS